jgi:pyruvate/2-oxoacid:ferredoxin oxidoreductase beta subunit
MRPELAIEIGRIAVQTAMFPLYEVENGRYHITHKIDRFRPLKDYLKPQGRFRHLTDDIIAEVEERLHMEYRRLEAKERMTQEEQYGSL